MSNCPVIEAETLRNLYSNEGLSQREIAKGYGISHTTVVKLMRNYNIQARKGGPPRIILDPTKIEELYNSGLSIVKIAKVYNCSTNVIQKRMKELGIQARKPWDYLPKRRIEVDSQKVKKLYVEEQLTTQEVATQLGLGKNLVRKRLKEYGWARNSSQAFAISKVKGRRKRSSPILGKIIKGVKGYVMIKSPGHHRADKGGYVFEHILVWEEYHHRNLPEGYIIHHLNGIRDDNRPENLAAMTRSKHAKIHHDEPYKKRIRQLEIENRQLRRALEDGQMIFTFNEN